MTVIILSACPAGLRGFVTRWMLEVSPGVFLGTPSRRVREILWAEVRTYSGRGRALLVYQTNTEQGYAFETHEHAWEPVDHDGLTLIRRPLPGAARPGNTPPTTPPPGWSKASRRRRFGRGR